jgi:sarcosine oxidase, subunit delta
VLRLPCPWCGDREESEFRYGGEAGVACPADPDALDDAAWSEYLFFRRNPKGWYRERWVHTSGCRQWFTVDRHTVTYEVRDPRPITAVAR